MANNLSSKVQPFAYSVITSRDRIKPVGYNLDAHMDILGKVGYDPITQLSNWSAVASFECLAGTYTTGPLWTDKDD